MKASLNLWFEHLQLFLMHIGKYEKQILFFELAYQSLNSALGNFLSTYVLMENWTAFNYKWGKCLGHKYKSNSFPKILSWRCHAYDKESPGKSNQPIAKTLWIQIVTNLIFSPRKFLFWLKTSDRIRKRTERNDPI